LLTHLGYCRIIYGSDRNHFYDIVVACHETRVVYSAHLILTFDGTTKILRKAEDYCPLKATEKIVDELSKNVGLVLGKQARHRSRCPSLTRIDETKVGDEMKGQRGMLDEEGIFQVFGVGFMRPPSDERDDTRDLVARRRGYGGYGGGGGYSNGGGDKRARRGYD
jgi:hypothetical protein